MTEVRLRNVNDLEWEQFKIYCKKYKKNPSEQLKKYIREAGRFEAVLETELRMKAIIDDVIAHLDLNTQAYLLNVKKGILPMINTEEENSHEVFNQP
ncbi:hypothetical protein CUS72_06860 [Enterococcus faecium]|uniref:hypothetical protein n=1 Tax=Enterococcus TaxID=1350 RepID=UPI000BA18F60|nr:MULTISPECIES: hypothetical protein [Enterococcus]EME8134382.1 hypothetical protein [Enterococcus faecium]EMF0202640.1 hypothetical protein [Enterococcus hirae]OZS41170.1 hypothetical protein CHB54_00215 [Enterococcus hirae]PQF76866.1 hypothetical protein CUS72_06860 [Enterococcus faecium]PWG75740.1 hypothetical protein DF186_10855 [Enterococcus hirae]